MTLLWQDSAQEPAAKRQATGLGSEPAPPIVTGDALGSEPAPPTVPVKGDGDAEVEVEPVRQCVASWMPQTCQLLPYSTASEKRCLSGLSVLPLWQLIENMKIGGICGRGGSGKVNTVKDRHTGKRYALKASQTPYYGAHTLGWHNLVHAPSA